MKKIILIASLLMASVAYTKDLICEKELKGEKYENEFSFTIFGVDDAGQGLGVIVYNTQIATRNMKAGEERFYWESSAIGREEDNSPFLITFQAVFDDADTAKYFFHPYTMKGGSVGGRSNKNLKCRYSE